MPVFTVDIYQEKKKRYKNSSACSRLWIPILKVLQNFGEVSILCHDLRDLSQR